MPKVVQFKVGMTCDGCKGAVTRILSKLDGVTSIEAVVEAKTVDVTCEDAVEASALLDALMKWSEKSGKSVELLE
ncbi:hypothetical protein B484DRAFT_336796 [Ochromonadaceae sp. CCMP2298]|nr:hypothetical protein B484DRAFT_336796 [Ochromonadaceae sp. CCMP2298]